MFVPSSLLLSFIVIIIPYLVLEIKTKFFFLPSLLLSFRVIIIPYLVLENTNEFFFLRSLFVLEITNEFFFLPSLFKFVAIFHSNYYFKFIVCCLTTIVHFSSFHLKQNKF
jgi:hypothetical protein